MTLHLHVQVPAAAKAAEADKAFTPKPDIIDIASDKVRQYMAVQYSTWQYSSTWQCRRVVMAAAVCCVLTQQAPAARCAACAGARVG